MDSISIETWARDRHVRSADSFRYAKEIVKRYGMLNHVLTWCRVTLGHEWRWQLVRDCDSYRPGRYIFYFDDPGDATLFALRWGDQDDLV